MRKDPDNLQERVSAKVIVLGWNNETPSSKGRGNWGVAYGRD